MAIEKLKAEATEKITVNNNETYEDEIRGYTKEELLHMLNYDETDPERIRIIKKVLKTKA
ncbi:MAG: hypothetical protein MJ223_02485 [Mycoplasmoidaceae bacterium]|nr:hypothetical protein [Mycoplasmoidaceae bacterium]